jgi:hypothetical protein
LVQVSVGAHSLAIGRPGAPAPREKCGLTNRPEHPLPRFAGGDMANFPSDGADAVIRSRKTYHVCRILADRDRLVGAQGERDPHHLHAYPAPGVNGRTGGRPRQRSTASAARISTLRRRRMWWPPGRRPSEATRWFPTMTDLRGPFVVGCLSPARTRRATAPRAFRKSPPDPLLVPVHALPALSGLHQVGQNHPPIMCATLWRGGSVHFRFHRVYPISARLPGGSFLPGPSAGAKLIQEQFAGAASLRAPPVEGADRRVAQKERRTTGGEGSGGRIDARQTDPEQGSD